MNSIINCTDKIKLNKHQAEIIEIVSSDLKKIEKNINSLEIVVRGGFIPDLLLGSEPRDIDLFYCIKNKSNAYSTKCSCDAIRKQIEKLNLKFIGKKYKYDLENSFEKEPRLKPVERTVGFFSYHTDWFSMFCLDTNARIWSNRKTLKYFNKKTFEIRYQGSLPWAYFPRETDSKDYYVSFTCEIIRGVSHVYRRQLKIGDDFGELLRNAPFILEKTLEVPQGKRALKYLWHKFNSINDLNKALTSLNLTNSNQIITGFRQLEVRFKSELDVASTNS